MGTPAGPPATPAGPATPTVPLLPARPGSGMASADAPAGTGPTDPPPTNSGPPPLPETPGARPTPGATPGAPGTASILGQDRLRRARRRRSLLASLSTDPRLAWWSRRAVISVTAGAIIGFWLDWRLGLTVAALVAIADAVYRSRTTAAIPATARVTSAQRRTRRRLARLAPAGYMSLHTRLIPGSTAVLDHLVVGPAGVYAVDSERWDRRLPVRATQGDRLFHGPYDQADLLRHARWTADQASRLIGGLLGQSVTVRAAIVIYGPVVPWVVARIAGVDVFRGRRLRRYLRREASARRASRLDYRQIELIHAAAAQALPPAR